METNITKYSVNDMLVSLVDLQVGAGHRERTFRLIDSGEKIKSPNIQKKLNTCDFKNMKVDSEINQSKTGVCGNAKRETLKSCSSAPFLAGFNPWGDTIDTFISENPHASIQEFLDYSDPTEVCKEVLGDISIGNVSVRDILDNSGKFSKISVPVSAQLECLSNLLKLKIVSLIDSDTKNLLLGVNFADFLKSLSPNPQDFSNMVQATKSVHHLCQDDNIKSMFGTICQNGENFEQVMGFILFSINLSRDDISSKNINLDLLTEVVQEYVGGAENLCQKDKKQCFCKQGDLVISPNLSKSDSNSEYHRISQMRVSSFRGEGRSMKVPSRMPA